ncbi:MAG: hypothetical protein AB1411_16880 [Nitrospirota bacterium]
MRSGLVFLALPLILLFLALSFNAYACVLPLFASPDSEPTDSTMQGRACSTPEEQAARQFCDAFKTLSVNNPAPSYTASDCQTFCPEDTTSLTLSLNLGTRSGGKLRYPESSPPRDLLLKSTVLRI